MNFTVQSKKLLVSLTKSVFGTKKVVKVFIKENPFKLIHTEYEMNKMFEPVSS